MTDHAVVGKMNTTRMMDSLLAVTRNPRRPREETTRTWTRRAKKKTFQSKDPRREKGKLVPRERIWSPKVHREGQNRLLPGRSIVMLWTRTRTSNCANPFILHPPIRCSEAFNWIWDGISFLLRVCSCIRYGFGSAFSL